VTLMPSLERLRQAWRNPFGWFADAGSPQSVRRRARRTFFGVAVIFGLLTAVWMWLVFEENLPGLLTGLILAAASVQCFRWAWRLRSH
jgi:hypothetical protein